VVILQEYVVGIDLGTSSVKVLCVNRKGETIRTGQPYNVDSYRTSGQNPAVFWNAIVKAFNNLNGLIDLNRISAIGITSQVGTYILYTPEKVEESLITVSWRDGGGAEQLKRLKNTFSTDYFIKHISMPHPDLISYPGTRALWFQDEMNEDWNLSDKFLQPKDYIYHKLTGVFATDAYSWRGLANLSDISFHDDLLNNLGISKAKLPELFNPLDAPGVLLPEIAEELGINSSIPVFVGCNDFFASLVGMGVIEQGQCFDMTGTSEHIGVISGLLDKNTSLVCGPYINGFIHYGVTANSGTAMSWAFKTFGKEPDSKFSLEEELLNEKNPPPPVFLPYMQGERAPIWDEKARGVFFGLECSNVERDLVYSVLEGVTFSLYHIWNGLSVTNAAEIRVAGGAAFDDGLNHIKADLFQLPFAVMKEKDSAALGAAIFAGLGCKWFSSLKEAADHWVKTDHIIRPEGRFKDVLKSRFEVYKGLYPALKDSFRQWNDYKEALKYGI
jgi:xylulokinase